MAVAIRRAEATMAAAIRRLFFMFLCHFVRVDIDGHVNFG